MSSIQQLVKKLGNTNYRKYKRSKIRTKAFKGSPQRLASVFKVFTVSPKKPNSAKRKMVKVTLTFNQKFLICHLPGESPSLQKFNNILIKGAYVRDIPGIKYRAIRGKLDFSSNIERRSSRSKYGVKKNT